MPEYLTQDEAFLKCRREGRVIYTESVDIEKIKATLLIAESDVRSADILRKSLPKEDSSWNSVYKLYYDALHELAESFLRFDKVKADNHQCLYAYLCTEHLELEFSWEFFEKVRTKRNGIHYYGAPISYKDWKEVELQFSLYIKKLEEEIDKRIELTKR